MPRSNKLLKGKRRRRHSKLRNREPFKRPKRRSRRRKRPCKLPRRNTGRHARALPSWWRKRCQEPSLTGSLSSHWSRSSLLKTRQMSYYHKSMPFKLTQSKTTLPSLANSSQRKRNRKKLSALLRLKLRRRLSSKRPRVPVSGIKIRLPS